MAGRHVPPAEPQNWTVAQLLMLGPADEVAFQGTKAGGATTALTLQLAELGGAAQHGAVAAGLQEPGGELGAR